MPPEIDPNDLAQSGWGMIFPTDLDPKIRGVLTPLVSARKQQCGERYQEIIYRPGETSSRFLGRHGVGPGITDPDRLPYYLMIVGPPDRIPFQFQQQLDIGYAVGRLHFDNVDDYARYALGVLDAELATQPAEKLLAIASPRISGDAHTELMSLDLIEPLRREASEMPPWMAKSWPGGSVTKEDVTELLRHTPVPALLMMAGHSVVVNANDPRRRTLHGAPVCVGPGAIGGGTPLDPGRYLSAEDVTDDMHLRGMMALLWGSFTAGCADTSAGPGPDGTMPATTPQPFISALAQRLLTHGALAVIGSIDRLLGYSFINLTRSRLVQTQAILRAMRGLMSGQRVGHAAQAFDESYATSVIELGEMMERVRFGSDVPAADLASLWAATTDLRNISIIGDPAVRLRAAVQGSTRA
jgi:hypothetical protein